MSALNLFPFQRTKKSELQGSGLIARAKQKHQPKVTCHCEERSDAPQGGLSCPFGAIHLLAIRIPCGALHRPAPEGPERERIATALTGFAMTVVVVDWSFYFG